MLLSPRWRKIWADLWISKTRTALVVMSIVVGIFAIGSIAGTGAILERESKELWRGINPASATIVSTTFGDDLVAQVEALAEVEVVQVRRSLDVRVEIAPGEFKDVRLFSVPDYEAMQLNTITSEQGIWPPADGSLLVERSALDLIGAVEGEALTLLLPTGEAVAYVVEGVAYDLSQPSATVLDVGYAYVSYNTMRQLAGGSGFNTLQFLVSENADDEVYINTVANSVRDLMESQGQIVFSLVVPVPGEPPGFIFIVALLLVLGVIGSLTFVLSGFLIINILSALLAQQTRQIGIMKAVGARTGQIIRMYLGMAGIFGVMALVIGLPLSFLGARGLATLIGELNNYQITDFSAPWWVFALQIAIGLIVPVVAALIPVISGTRVSVRAALDSRGIGSGNNGLIDRVLARFSGLPRPVMLSFRNTFRQKGRLALTIVTLTLAGAIFATVFTVRNSLFATLDDALGYDAYDVTFDLDRAYPVADLMRVAYEVDGVASAEAWTNAVGRYQESEESADIAMLGLPPGSQMITPIISEGRWLEPGDTNVVVINDNLVLEMGDVAVGDTISLVVRGQETSWEVVGIARAIFSFENNAWTPFAALAGVIGERDQARIIRVQVSDGELQNEIVEGLSAALTDEGILVQDSQTRAALETSLDLRFNTLVFSLLALAGLLAIVGGLGIAGTTSINVLERMREIGVMRSVGAANYQILGIFIVEAVFVGIIGWMFGSIMALPISRLLSDGVGNAFSNAPLTYSFDVSGAVLWLVLAVLLALLSSFFPARRASQITLREVLAYDG